MSRESPAHYRFVPSFRPPSPLSLIGSVLLISATACSDPAELPDPDPEVLSVEGHWLGSFHLESNDATIEAEFHLQDEPDDWFSGHGEFRWSIPGDEEQGEEPRSGSWDVTIEGLRTPEGETLLWQGLDENWHVLGGEWDFWLRWTEIMVEGDDDRTMQTTIGGGAPASGNFGQLRSARAESSLVLQSIMVWDINPNVSQQTCESTSQCYQLMLERQ